MLELRLPDIQGKNEAEQIAQIKSYLFQLVPQLQISFNTLEETVTVDKKPSGENATDVVSSRGIVHFDEADASLGYWRYRKWQSGNFDMSGIAKVVPVSESATGNGYYSMTIRVPLPFAVKSIQFACTATSDTMVAYSGDSETEISFKLFRFTDFTDLAETYVRIVASGTYK